VHSNLGKALLESGQPAAALRAYERAFLLDPRTVEPLNAQASIHLDYLGDTATARAILERVLRLTPSYLPAHNNLGVALMRTNQDEAAAATFEGVLRRDPQNAEATYNLAALRVNTKNYARARELLASGIGAWPGHARMRALLALVHAADGDLDAAERAVSAAVGIAPDDRMVVAVQTEIRRRRHAGPERVSGQALELRR
jgi:Flp pilus assembly protein TadD